MLNVKEKKNMFYMKKKEHLSKFVMWFPNWSKSKVYKSQLSYLFYECLNKNDTVLSKIKCKFYEFQAGINSKGLNSKHQ